MTKISDKVSAEILRKMRKKNAANKVKKDDLPTNIDNSCVEVADDVTKDDLKNIQQSD